MEFLGGAPEEVWMGKPLVRDHCHWTGAYRGAACQSCNSKMQEPKVIKVPFHNLEGFDGHELIQAITRLRGASQAASEKGARDSDDEEEACLLYTSDAADE